MVNKNKYRLLLIFLAGSSSLSVYGQDLSNGLPSYTTTSVINSDALSQVHGRLTINMAAGDSNAQINMGALTINQNAGVASAHATALQVKASAHATSPDLSTALIDNNAFTNSVGAISINQTSGQLNSQANGLAFALGSEVEAVSENILSETSSGAGLIDAESTMGTKTASIADTAFVGSRGLVQINQSSGSSNTTANNFTFQSTLGVNP